MGLKKISVVIALSIVLLLLLSGFGLLVLQQTIHLTPLRNSLQQHQGLFFVWRWCVWGGVIFLYPYLLQRYYGHRDNIHQQGLIRLAKRRYALLFCIAVELLFVDNGLSRLFNGLAMAIGKVVTWL